MAVVAVVVVVVAAVALVVVVVAAVAVVVTVVVVVAWAGIPGPKLFSSFRRGEFKVNFVNELSTPHPASHDPPLLTRSFNGLVRAAGILIVFH